MFNYIRLLFLSLLAFALTSCNTPSPKDSSLRLNFTQFPSSLDPRTGGDFTSSTLQFLLFEGLTRSMPHSTSDLGIAKKIDISKDGRTYTFHLKDAHWSNGEKITAYDFERTWKEILSPNFPAPNAHLFYPIKNSEKVKRGLVPIEEVGITPLNEKTLKITLEEKTPHFLEVVSFCSFCPTYKNQQDSLPIVNGPYKLTKWKIGEEILLQKNPFYWDKDNVHLEHITISLVENEMTAFEMFEKGDLHLLGLPYTDIPIDALKTLKEKNLIKQNALPASTLCAFNTKRFPFHNLSMRKAFSYAINRKEIIENIYELSDETPHSLLPPLLFKENPTDAPYEENLSLAKAHFQKGLQELGITKDEFKISFIHATSDLYKRTAQALQQQWKKAFDIDVALEGLEYKLFLNKLLKKQFQIGACIWIAQYNDPMSLLERFQYSSNPKNYSGWSSLEYNQLLKKSIHAKTAKERLDTLKQAEALLIKECPVTPIFHWKSSYIKSPLIKNLLSYPTGGFFLSGVEITKKTGDLK